MSGARKPTAAQRLDALTDAFLYRPGFDGLSAGQAERLGAQTEAHALYGLLGALQSELGPFNRSLTREGVLKTIEQVLERAMEREREGAARLGGTPQPVYVHAGPDDDAKTLCGGGGPVARTGERDAVTCPQCAVLLVGRDAAADARPNPDRSVN